MDANRKSNRGLLSAIGCGLAPGQQTFLAPHRASPVVGIVVWMEFRSNLGKLQDRALCTVKWHLAQCLPHSDPSSKEVAGLQLRGRAELSSTAFLLLIGYHFLITPDPRS